MLEDRRKGDRRKNGNKEFHEKKTLTVSLTAFVTFVAVIAITFVTTACFLAVYYERRINDIYANYESSQELVYSPIDDIDYFDVENIIDDPNVSTDLITDPNLVEENSVDETIDEIDVETSDESVNETSEDIVDESSIENDVTE